MIDEQRMTLLDLSTARALFAPDAVTGPIHRQLVMAGLAACRVEFSGEWISISDKGRAEIAGRMNVMEAIR